KRPPHSWRFMASSGGMKVSNCAKILTASSSLRRTAWSISLWDRRKSRRDMADYILTIIEQVGLMLAELARLKSGEKPAGISVLCLRETGLPLAVVKLSSSETILQLRQSGGGTQG